ncbi:MAG: low temperature requirement protein A [Saccharopolyspora sp.]|nr:low temperature requirement protein A [Saccharopolyspora sp. HNM0986]MBQ6644369.1 low temperature requirement protein A [Saccharopolyspora sp.]
MTARDPWQEHRAATPLELLFDLCFVAAVSQAATMLHHALTEGHIGTGVLGYFMVFFAIWWAWVNFTWFASAYDTDDGPYRVLTLVQMAGVLVLAAGIPAALDEYDFTVITFGYVLMRVAMVAQWLRAAREHPEGRPAALRYAAGVTAVQIAWLLRLLLPHPWDYAGFAVLAIAEVAVPAWAESGNRQTSWHPEHIAERYGLFTIIVLGEAILGVLNAVSSALTAQGLSTDLMLTTAGGLVLVFALWWIYFVGQNTRLPNLKTALTWGYGHYLLYAAVAALGAGLEVAVDATQHHAHMSEQTAALAVAVPVAGYLLVIGLLHGLTRAGTATAWIVGGNIVVVLLLAAAAGPLGLGGTVLAMGVVTAASLAVNLARAHRQAVR